MRLMTGRCDDYKHGQMQECDGETKSMGEHTRKRHGKRRNVTICLTFIMMSRITHGGSIGIALLISWWFPEILSGPSRLAKQCKGNKRLFLNGCQWRRCCSLSFMFFCVEFTEKITYSFASGVILQHCPFISMEIYLTSGV